MNENFVFKVADSIREAIGAKKAALHEPIFSGNEIAYLKDCIDSTYVSSVGSFVDRFEEQLVTYTGAKYAVAVVNGTAALHVGLKILGVKEGSEVLLPALTFVATANAIRYCGGNPHFVDSDADTLGIDIQKLRKYLDQNTKQINGKCVNKNTGCIVQALIAVHVFGHMAKVEEINQLARDYNIALLEDAAGALGSFYKGQHAGSFGRVGIISFNGNKTITTGGGGIILTNDERLAAEAKHLSTTAKMAHQWDYIHDQVGFNYRLPNLNAALGCAQMENLSKFRNAKRSLFQNYEKAFSNIKGASVFREPLAAESNYWLQAIVLDSSHIQFRDEILKKTNEVGLMTRPVWKLLNSLVPYQKFQTMNLSGADQISRSVINVPSTPKLTSSCMNN